MEAVVVSLRDLPSVDRLLQSEPASSMVQEFGRELTKQALRETLAEARTRAKEGDKIPGSEDLLDIARERLVDWRLSGPLDRSDGDLVQFRRRWAAGRL